MSNLRQPDDGVERELVAHALGELDAVERERLERRLADDPDLRSRFADASATVLALSQLPREAWDAGEPPPAPTLEIDPPTSAAASTLPEHAGRRRRLRWPGGPFTVRPLATVVAATALVAIGVLVGVVVKSTSGSTTARIVAITQLAPIDKVDPSARAVFRLESDQTASFTVSGLAPTDSRHVYELWLMDSTRDLVSIATFRVGSAGHAQLTMTLPVSPSHFHYLDVSLQPLDGTAAQSKISVLRGATPA
jgi:anti-sigma-K factor RskA